MRDATELRRRAWQKLRLDSEQRRRSLTEWTEQVIPQTENDIQGLLQRWNASDLGREIAAKRAYLAQCRADFDRMLRPWQDLEERVDPHDSRIIRIGWFYDPHKPRDDYNDVFYEIRPVDEFGSVSGSTDCA